MNKNEIFTCVDEAINDSEMFVAESMISAYLKALTIMENANDSESLMNYSIMQEADSSAANDAAGESKSDNNTSKADSETKNAADEVDAKKKNIIKRLIEAIVKFFKAIANSIKNFFKKNDCDEVVKKLKDAEKLNIPADQVDEIQEAVDKKSEEIDNKEEVKTVISNIKSKLKNKKKDNASSDKDESTNDTIDVKNRKIRTRISFEGYIKFYENVIKDIDDFNNNLHISGIYNANEYVVVVTPIFAPKKYKFSEAVDLLNKTIDLMNKTRDKIEKMDMSNLMSKAIDNPSAIAALQERQRFFVDIAEIMRDTTQTLYVHLKKYNELIDIINKNIKKS